jgi:hypothetical protein
MLTFFRTYRQAHTSRGKGLELNRRIDIVRRPIRATVSSTSELILVGPRPS